MQGEIAASFAFFQEVFSCGLSAAPGREWTGATFRRLAAAGPLLQAAFLHMPCDAPHAGAAVAENRRWQLGLARVLSIAEIGSVNRAAVARTSTGRYSHHGSTMDWIGKSGRNGPDGTTPATTYWLVGVTDRPLGGETAVVPTGSRMSGNGTTPKQQPWKVTCNRDDSGVRRNGGSPGAIHVGRGGTDATERHLGQATTAACKEGWCCWRGLNSRPLPYQGSALPLSYNSSAPPIPRTRRRLQAVPAPSAPPARGVVDAGPGAVVRCLPCLARVPIPTYPRARRPAPRHAGNAKPRRSATTCAAARTRPVPARQPAQALYRASHRTAPRTTCSRSPAATRRDARVCRRRRAGLDAPPSPGDRLTCP